MNMIIRDSTKNAPLNVWQTFFTISKIHLIKDPNGTSKEKPSMNGTQHEWVEK